jgi:hypothetical protein
MQNVSKMIVVAAALAAAAFGCDSTDKGTVSPGSDPNMAGTASPQQGSRGIDPAGQPGASMTGGQPAGPGQNTGMAGQGTGSMATADAGTTDGGTGLTGSGAPTGQTGRGNAPVGR